MTKYLLSQWQAIELFCKVITKYENILAEEKKLKIVPIKMDDFSSNEFLLQMLRKYENPVYYRPFGEVYIRKIASLEGITRYYPKTLYELSHEIRFSIPIVKSMDELSLLLIFIGERNNFMEYKPLNMWIPSERLRRFENTRWWLYYFEDYFDPQTQSFQQGITRACVYFKSFAKLEIQDIDASKGEPGRLEKYTGQYSIHGGLKGVHLLLEGNMGVNLARDLHILLHIGDDELRPGEIAIGQFHNVQSSIYSGTVIMEKYSQRGSIKPEFFKFGDKRIDPVYWRFFYKENKNRIRSEAGIKSKESLNLWLDKKDFESGRNDRISV